MNEGHIQRKIKEGSIASSFSLVIKPSYLRTYRLTSSFKLDTNKTLDNPRKAPGVVEPRAPDDAKANAGKTVFENKVEFSWLQEDFLTT